MTNDSQTNRPPLRAVVFDLDGTLLNCPYDFAAMRQAVLEIAADVGLEPEALTGLGILEAIAEGEQLLEPEAGRQFRHRADEAVLQIERRGAEQSAALPGAQETLRWLHEHGLRTAIITRNSRKVVDTLLRHVEFQYDALLAREAVASVKPHPEHLLAALGHLRCEPHESMMVGDHVWDIACGRAAGVATVGVVTGASSRTMLEEAGAEVILTSVTELPAWLSARYVLPGETRAC